MSELTKDPITPGQCKEAAYRKATGDQTHMAIALLRAAATIEALEREVAALKDRVADERTWQDWHAPPAGTCAEPGCTRVVTRCGLHS